MRSFRAAALAALFLSALNAGTQITDTLFTPFSGAGRFTGRLVISAPSMKTADNRTIAAAQLTIEVSNGALSVNLEPNDTALPAGTSYQVRYYPAVGATWLEAWVVPTSGSPLKVNQVRTSVVPSPLVTFRENQLQFTAAGDLLFATGGGVGARLPVGSQGQVLTVDGGLPVWRPSAAAVVNLTQIATRNYADLQGIPSAFTPSAHSHNASADLTAGTVAPVRGGLGADASAFSGVLKFSAGLASTVTGTPADCIKVDGSSGPCGSGGGGGPERYANDFTSQTSVVILGSTHGIPTADLSVTVYDGSTPRNELQPEITVDPATRNVTISFAVSQSGRYVISGSDEALYASDFIGQTTLLVPGATHGLSSADLSVRVWDASTPRKKIEADISVHPTSRDVTIAFASAQSGRYALQ